MRIVICDNDGPVRKQMTDTLVSFLASKHISDAEIVPFDNAYDLLRDSGRKDIVFLEPELPGMNGIFAGRELRKENPDAVIIAVSAFSAYVGEVMQFQAFRFLYKPLGKTVLQRCLEDALKAYLERSVKFMVKAKDEDCVLESNRIVMLETREHKTIIHTTEKEYRSARSLSYWLEMLPRDVFILTHRSFLVNVNFVERFNHSTVYLSARNLQAFLTKRKYASFKNRLYLFLGGRS